MACAGVVAAVPIHRAGSDASAAVLWVAGLGLLTLLAGLVLARGRLVAVGIALVGATYAAQLALDDALLDAAAPVVAAGLFAAAELAYWSLDERDRAAGEASTQIRHAAYVTTAALGTVVVGAALLAVVDVARAGGVSVDLAGALAAVGVLVVVALVGIRSRERRA